MATPFLGLNQYAGGDVVSYLDGGYNSDMSKIDTGVQNASQKADAVESEVGAIKAASDKNSADIVTLTNGLSSTNQNVTDLTSTVNLVKNDVFVQYTATLNSTTITISGSGGNSFYFIMPETFSTTFAYVVNGVICTLVNMGGTSFKNRQIAKGAPVFVRLIGTVMYAVGALESEGGSTPFEIHNYSYSLNNPGIEASSYDCQIFYSPETKLLNIALGILGIANPPAANTTLIDLSTIPYFKELTGSSYIVSAIWYGTSQSQNNGRFVRDGNKLKSGGVLAGATQVTAQLCLNTAFWN